MPISIEQQLDKNASIRMATMAIPISSPRWLQQARCVSHPELQIVYDEIHVKRQYDRCGVSVLPGYTVIDVGANVGIFST